MSAASHASHASRHAGYSVLDHIVSTRKPPADRLAELREYADGLALRAEYLGQGSQRDLEGIVKALDELRDLRAWAKSRMEPVVTNEKPLPKHNAGKTPKPKRHA